MPDLEWSVTPDGHEAAGYRIRQVEARPPCWRLETLDDPVYGGARTPAVSVHPSLQAAKRRAGRDERDRIRLARVRGHILLSLIAGPAFVGLMTSGRSIEEFVTAMVLLHATLRSLEDAINIGWSHAWNWDHATEGPERMSWSARIVLFVTEWLRKRQLMGTADSESPSIIVLPPELPPSPVGSRAARATIGT
jgi:hypothetical protein